MRAHTHTHTVPVSVGARTSGCLSLVKQLGGRSRKKIKAKQKPKGCRIFGAVILIVIVIVSCIVFALAPFLLESDQISHSVLSVLSCSSQWLTVDNVPPQNKGLNLSQFTFRRICLPFRAIYNFHEKSEQQDLGTRARTSGSIPSPS